MSGSPARERLGPLIARVREQAAEFVAREADVRSAAPEGVHRMRVAVRRLRSCLRTFRPAFEPAAARHLRDELKWIGDLLGAERDAEVITDRIARDVGELGDGGTRLFGRQLGLPGIGASIDPHGDLLDAMDSPRYRALVEELAAFAISPPLDDSDRGCRWLVRRLIREIRRAEALVDDADLVDRSERDRALHEVRKVVKQVRYAAETLVPTYGDKARRIARTYEEIQTTLGEHHDAVVTRAVLRNERAHAGVGSADDAFDLGVLYAREESRAADAEAEFMREWGKARRLVRQHWPNR